MSESMQTVLTAIKGARLGQAQHVSLLQICLLSRLKLRAAAAQRPLELLPQPGHKKGL